VGYDAAVVATGAHPRVLPGTPDLEGIHVLRTLDDSLALRDAFLRGPRVTVVGAGFIGAEVAASARRSGLSVTLVEALPVPLSRGLGPRMGRVLGEMHVDHGVDLRCGVTVAGFEGDGRVERLQLSDDSVVETDLVVVGVGVAPSTGWLEGSGLELRDGVVCDESLRAAPGVFAAGDVARWPNPVFHEEMRVEHWTNASEQAEAVAANVLAGPDALAPFASVPWVWSDQYEHRIQVVGRPGPGDDVEVVFGSVEERRFLALYGRGGRLVGALAIDCPRQLAPYLRKLESLPPFADAVAEARS
jgi:NADPH-dependent 2,4-dienoyl-CoA reductase/sulfur reductase-like enzyme